MARPRGINAARKLARTRRINRWADKAYKKSHLSTRWKSNPFGMASHAKGIVIEKMYSYFHLFHHVVFSLLIKHKKSVLNDLISAPSHGIIKSCHFIITTGTFLISNVFLL